MVEDADRGAAKGTEHSVPLRGAAYWAPQRGPLPARKTSLALVAAMAALALIDTSLFDTIQQTLFKPAADYAQTRRDVGFGGIDMEAVAEAIDRRLPPDEAVSLASSITSNPLLLQRFSEGLYPRRIDPKAAHQVTVGAVLGTMPLASNVYLLGPAAEPKLIPRQYTISSDLGRSLLLSVSLLGLGLVMLAGARRFGGAGRYLIELTPALLLPVATLVGILTIAFISSSATLVHVHVHWDWIAAVGLAGALGVVSSRLARLLRSGAVKLRLRVLARGAFSVLRRPEVLLGLCFLVFAAYLIDRTPLVKWDTRSIWFFRAKQLFFEGRFLSQDALDYPFAHAGYPLLFPTTLSFFSAFGGWNERRAAFGIAILLATLSSLVFMLSRRALGRWAGALFALFPGLYLYELLVGGYADGHVTLCLLIAALGFCEEDTEEIGWLGAFAAALIKREGLVLAGILGAIHSLIGRPSRQRSMVRRGLPFLGFLPPVLHGLWGRHVGAAEAYAKSKWPTHAHAMWSRLSMILESIRNQGWGRTPAKIGLAGLFLSLIFARNWRNARGGAGASLTGVFAAVFTCIIFMVTPFDLRWHLASALQRLIAHQWFLLALGGVLLSAKAGR